MSLAHQIASRDAQPRFSPETRAQAPGAASLTDDARIAVLARALRETRAHRGAMTEAELFLYLDGALTNAEIRRHMEAAQDLAVRMDRGEA